jgi:ankyrin repeat protein
MIAARRNLFEVVEYLIHLGGEINGRNQEGHTPLILAYQNGCKQTVELLVRYGADPLARDYRVSIFDHTIHPLDNIIIIIIMLIIILFTMTIGEFNLDHYLY